MFRSRVSGEASIVTFIYDTPTYKMVYVLEVGLAFALASKTTTTMATATFRAQTAAVVAAA